MSGDESADEESTPRKRQFIHTQRKCLARDNFQKDGTEENESHVYITRSGRKAGTWKRFDSSAFSTGEVLVGLFSSTSTL